MQATATPAVAVLQRVMIARQPMLRLAEEFGFSNLSLCPRAGSGDASHETECPVIFLADMPDDTGLLRMAEFMRRARELTGETLPVYDRRGLHPALLAGYREREVRLAS